MFDSRGVILFENPLHGALPNAPLANSIKLSNLKASKEFLRLKAAI
jgi:hypothetical protein